MQLVAMHSLHICIVALLLCATDGARPPNILLFMADDLAIGDVGIYGNTTLRTPNIDNIGRQGAIFTQHLAAGPTCTPSRSAFLTGRYPKRSGMAPKGFMPVLPFVACLGGLPQSEVTFAELAKDVGYKTALIGKWHLGLYCDEYGTFCHHPLQHGFDYFYGVPLTNLKDFGHKRDGSVIDNGAPYVYEKVSSASVLLLVMLYILHNKGFIGRLTLWTWVVIIISLVLFVVFFLRNLKLWSSVLMRDYAFIEQPIRLDNNLTQRLVNEGSHIIRDSVANDQPFLLFMSWIQVHTAMHASAQFAGGSKHGRYGDNVEELDWSVGEILNVVKEVGQLENTFVYFTSDNGGHVEEHDIHGNREGGFNGVYRGSKGQASMDGALRVPGAAMWSGVIPPGVVLDRPTSLMDVFPTIANIMRSPTPSNVTIDGKDLLPTVTRSDAGEEHDVLFHYCNSDIVAARLYWENVTWKLHYVWPAWDKATEGCEGHHICGCGDATWLDTPLLYNMDVDPSERNPLNLQQHAHIVARIEQLKSEHLKGVEPVPPQFTVPNLIWRPWLQHCCNFPYCDCEE